MARHTQDEDEVVLMKVATTICKEAENLSKIFENLNFLLHCKMFFHQKKKFPIAIKLIKDAS